MLVENLRSLAMKSNLLSTDVAHHFGDLPDLFRRDREMVCICVHNLLDVDLHELLLRLFVQLPLLIPRTECHEVPIKQHPQRTVGMEDPG